MGQSPNASAYFKVKYLTDFNGALNVFWIQASLTEAHRDA